MMKIFTYKSGPGLLPSMLLAVLVLAVATPLYADKTVSPGTGTGPGTGPGASPGRTAVDRKKSKLPAYYPDTFQRTGVVNGLSSSRSVLINGTRYYYDHNTKVHTLSTKSGFIHDLSKGTEVGFSYIEDNMRRRFLVEAWTLPHGTVKRN
jgi:hypothetical protein